MQLAMVDLNGQYLKIKREVDEAIQTVIQGATFINGPMVKSFSEALSEYHQDAYVQTCGNGTDALQIALMALELQPGDEVIMPAFTYFATVEVALLLGLKPVFVDVDAITFNINPALVKSAITDKTKAIIAVHLFGQPAEMEPLLQLAKEFNLFLLEDNAQAIGAKYTFENGSESLTGTIGDIGCTSFFPSKNLGCFGDGGAITTKNETFFQRIKALSNHGQYQKYHHELVGVNSRLDSIQAAVLQVKLKHLDTYNEARRSAASYYDNAFSKNNKLQTPSVNSHSKAVYHQYTLILDESINRDKFVIQLKEQGIPTMIYYPIPCHQQKAYLELYPEPQLFPVAEMLSQRVISLPMHTEMDETILDYIVKKVNEFTS